MAAYGAAPSMTADSPTSQALEDIPTRLNAFKPAQQGHLINWGYALCDVSLREQGPPDRPAAHGLAGA
jgi:NTE family protein